MDINFWGVLCATVASFGLGGLWYSKLLFGTVWNREAGIDEAAAAHPAKVFGLAFVFTAPAVPPDDWSGGSSDRHARHNRTTPLHQAPETSANPQSGATTGSN